MSIEHNKELATTFFAHLSAGDIAAALEMIADDGTWTVIGKQDLLSSAGLYSKDRLARLFQFMFKQFKDGLKMTIKGAIGEGDSVALEAESYGELTNGRIYNQSYHLLMEFRDGKISVVREYLDTQHVYAVWLEPLPTTAQS